MQNRLPRAIFVAALALASIVPALSGSVGNHVARSSRVHRSVVRALSNNTIEKRGASAKGAPATWYNVETGNQVSCGGFYHSHDSIIAINAADFGGGGLCGKGITIEYHGNTQHATIVDRCAGCGPRGIDLTEGLFSSLAGLGQGEIYVNWYIGAPPAPPPPPPPPSHKPPPPKPAVETHTTTKHRTTSTTTSTHHHHTSTAKSSSSSSTSSSSYASPSAASNITMPSGPNNIASLFGMVVKLGDLAVAAVN